MEWYWIVAICVGSLGLLILLSCLFYKLFFKRFYDIFLSPEKQEAGRVFWEKHEVVKEPKLEIRLKPSFMDILLFRWLFKD